MKEFILESPYKLQEIIQYVKENPQMLDNYCLFTERDESKAYNNLICYISGQ